MAEKTSTIAKKSARGTDLSQLGKKMPYDIELEQAVLGAMMIEKEALTEVIEILQESTFYKDAHQYIFGAIKTLFSQSEPIDILTVTSQLRSNGELELAGGAYYITQLTHRVNSSANIVYHTRLLQQHSIKRDLIQISNETLRDAFEDTTDVFELLDKTEQSLFEVSELNLRRSYSSLPNLMNEVVKEMETLRDHKDGLTGIPSGFSELDRATSGWQKSDLIIFAARPGMGKTAFVLSAMRNAAVEFNRPIAFFSLEMASTQLVKRLISAEAEIESAKLKTGQLSEFEWSKFVNKTTKLTDSPIFIDDTPALSVLELRAKARRLKAQHNIEMIIVDYLQLMTAGSKNSGNREQEIAMISRSLKQIAKELNVPVIALSQLSRAVEVRGGDKKPQLSDLRESGSIEQDADMVIFLYRPEYYGITEDESGNPVQGMGEVIIAKHRNGALLNVPLKFIGEFTKFTDWEHNTFFGDDDVPSGFQKLTLSSKINNDTPDESDDDDPPF